MTRHLAIVAKSQPDLIRHDVLRLTLDEPSIDRLSRLAVRVDELVEAGYTTNEIRRHLMKVDAANAGDTY